MAAAIDRTCLEQTHLPFPEILASGTAKRIDFGKWVLEDESSKEGFEWDKIGFGWISKKKKKKGLVLVGSIQIDLGV